MYRRRAIAKLRLFTLAISTGSVTHGHNGFPERLRNQDVTAATSTSSAEVAGSRIGSAVRCVVCCAWLSAHDQRHPCPAPRRYAPVTDE